MTFVIGPLLYVVAYGFSGFGGFAGCFPRPIER